MDTGEVKMTLRQDRNIYLSITTYLKGRLLITNFHPNPLFRLFVMINRSMDLTSDDELLRQARHFDLPALSAIYDRYSNGLYYYAVRLLGDTVIAEDCVAEAFSHLLKVLKSGGGPRDNLKGYLYRCVHNWVTDYYRRKPTLTLDLYSELPDPEESPSQQTEQHIACQRLRAALRELTTDQRQVITLHFIEGWDIAEIAENIQKPVGAVKSLQHRALASLQRLLLKKKRLNYGSQRHTRHSTNQIV